MPTHDELRKLAVTEPDPRLRLHYAEQLAKWEARRLDPERTVARFGHPIKPAWEPPEKEISDDTRVTRSRLEAQRVLSQRESNVGELLLGGRGQEREIATRAKKPVDVAPNNRRYQDATYPEVARMIGTLLLNHRSDEMNFPGVKRAIEELVAPFKAGDKSPDAKERRDAAEALRRYWNEWSDLNGMTEQIGSL